MNPSLYTGTAVLLSILFIGGCSNDRVSDYPDRSPETTRKVDNVKASAREKRDALNQEYTQTSNKFDFRERQIREKYKAERESAALESDKKAAEQQAQQRNIEIQAQHDKDRIDAEVAEKIKTSQPDEVAQLKADAAQKKAEIDNKLTKKQSPIHEDTSEREGKLRQRLIEIDRDEAKELSALNRERAQAQNDMHAKNIELDRWTSDELSKLDKRDNVDRRNP